MKASNVHASAAQSQPTSFVFFFSVGFLCHKKIILDVEQYFLLGLERFCIRKQHTHAFLKQRCPPM